jgi:hypothetical protein
MKMARTCSNRAHKLGFYDVSALRKNILSEDAFQFQGTSLWGLVSSNLGRTSSSSN